MTGSSRDKVSLALADHSVGWDIVTLGGLDLARRLSQVVLRDQVPARWSLLSHVYRNMGVLLNKRNRWGEALTQVVNGLETLDLLSRGAWSSTSGSTRRPPSSCSSPAPASACVDSNADCSRHGSAERGTGPSSPRPAGPRCGSVAGPCPSWNSSTRRASWRRPGPMPSSAAPSRPWHGARRHA
ncbi:hypothetical protein ACFQZC_01410 [Streptacidiphilus monticola]